MGVEMALLIIFIVGVGVFFGLTAYKSLKVGMGISNVCRANLLDCTCEELYDMYPDAFSVWEESNIINTMRLKNCEGLDS